MTQRESDARRDAAGTGVAVRNPSLAQCSDLELLAGIRDAQRGALAEVFHRHSGSLYELAAKICGPQNGERIVWETLLALWREPERFEPGRSSLRCRLLEAGHARAVERTRDDPARQRWITTLMPPSKRGSKLMVSALADQLGASAWQRVSVLPNDERNVIALAYFGGFTCAELGSLFGLSRRAIAAQLRSGLFRLRRRSLAQLNVPRHTLDTKPCLNMAADAQRSM